MKRAASSKEVVENSDAPLDLTVKKRDSQQQPEQPLQKQGVLICRECQIEFQDNDSFVKHKKNDCPYRTEQQRSTVVPRAMVAAVAASSVGQEASKFLKFKVWRCNFCHYISSFNKIWSHQLKHVQFIRYGCKKCGFKCMTIRDLWLHAGFHNIQGQVVIEEFIRTQFAVDVPLPLALFKLLPPSPPRAESF